MSMREGSDGLYPNENMEATADAERAETRIAAVRPSIRGDSPDSPAMLANEVAHLVDSAALATCWNVPESWIRSRTNRKRTDDPIPHVRLGRYIRFRLGSQELDAWLNRQSVSTDRVGSKRRTQ
jgi:hypothetical protein